MAASLRAVWSQSLSAPAAALANLPICSNSCCPRTQTLWQRWWIRNDGIRFDQDWYCSPTCFEAALTVRLDKLMRTPPDRAIRNRIPLGLVLLAQGSISEDQLREALRQQRLARHGKIGEWLVNMGAVSEQDVTAAVGMQQACPVFSAATVAPVPAEAGFPLQLMQRYHAVPVLYNAAQSTLYVGFLGTVNRGFLHSLEHVLHCSTVPCIVPTSLFAERLERRFAPAEVTVVIEQGQTVFEMTRMITDYAVQVHADRCGIACCDTLLWARLTGKGRIPFDLLLTRSFTAAERSTSMTGFDMQPAGRPGPDTLLRWL